MNSFPTLFLGDLQRMARYKVLAASLVVSFIWMGVLHFTEIQDVTNIFPLLLFFDATAMSILLVGVSMFFEKQENTLKSLLAAPIGRGEYIAAKVSSNIVSNVITLVILVTYALIFKEISVNIPGLFVVIILVSLLHSLIGFLITYYSKDFTTLLMGMFAYSLLFTIPIVLEQVGLITNELVSNLLYIIPTKSAMTLLNATVHNAETSEVILSFGYLLFVSVVCYIIVRKKFDAYAVKESGI